MEGDCFMDTGGDGYDGDERVQLSDVLCPACYARLEEITAEMVRLGLWLQMGPDELVVKALERLSYEHAHRN